MTTTTTTADELIKLAKEIIKIGDEYKALKNIDLDELSQEELINYRNTLVGFRRVFENHRLELARIWLKIDKAEREAKEEAEK